MSAGPRIGAFCPALRKGAGTGSGNTMRAGRDAGAAARCGHRIGTSPAPNAVSMRTSSHFGPTSTSGKSPTGT